MGVRTLLTDPHELAEHLVEWARGDPVVLMLRLAGIDRTVVTEAYEILQSELLPREVEAEVDAEIAARGLPTEEELEALERELASMPQRRLTAGDKAKLEQIARDAAAAVQREFPHLSRDEKEQVLFQRLREMADRGQS